MKLLKWWKGLVIVPVLAVVIPVATQVSAQPAGEWYEPTKIVFKVGGLPDAKSEAEGCKASAADLNAHDGTRKETYVGFKQGSSPFSITCILKDKQGKQWTQDNRLTKKLFCNDGTEAVSWDNSGTFESQKCKCDPAGCPKKQTGPTERQPLPCPAINAQNPVCKDRKKLKRSAEEEKRCTQQPAHPVKAEDVANQSRANKASLTRDPAARAASEKYNKALDAIRKDERNRREVNTGRDHEGNEFPKFGKDDMCETGGPTDINIGSLCGTREEDFAAANNMVGLGKTPAFSNAPNIDCVWHHHEELGRMQLVKREAHQKAPHTGGVKVWQDAFGVEYPLCCP